jgi:glycine hydroxymethyltransferase
MAHYSGLVASQLMNSPFEYCDIVTSTTHKSLRGPRSGVIFCKKEYTEKINFAVFPMHQGGPHNVQIAALATQFKEVMTEEFKKYSADVIDNARALAAALKAKGEKLITDGTDTHIVMWDCRQHELTGSKVEKLLDLMHITVNKNSVVGDKSAVTPGGIRLGTGALTTRGFVKADFEKIADYCIKSIEIGKRIQEKTGKKLVDFEKALKDDEEIKQIAVEVNTWAKTFSLPGQ